MLRLHGDEIALGSSSADLAAEEKLTDLHSDWSGENNYDEGVQGRVEKEDEDDDADLGVFQGHPKAEVACKVKQMSRERA